MQTLKIYVSSLRCLSAHFTEKRKFVVANQLLASILGFPFLIIRLFWWTLQRFVLIQGFLVSGMISYLYERWCSDDVDHLNWSIDLLFTQEKHSCALISHFMSLARSAWYLTLNWYLLTILLLFLFQFLAYWLLTIYCSK